MHTLFFGDKKLPRVPEYFLQTPNWPLPAPLVSSCRGGSNDKLYKNHIMIQQLFFHSEFTNLCQHTNVSLFSHLDFFFGAAATHSWQKNLHFSTPTWNYLLPRCSFFPPLIFLQTNIHKYTNGHGQLHLFVRGGQDLQSDHEVAIPNDKENDGGGIVLTSGEKIPPKGVATHSLECNS